MTEREIRDLVLEERRKYAREWRAKNPDKVREANRRYWTKKAMQRAKSNLSEVSNEAEET